MDQGREYFADWRRGVAITVGAIFLVAQWVATMLKPRGDFSIHWEFGRRFRCGEPLYSNGLDLPYPPFFAMVNAPLSLLPLRVAKPFFFLLGAGSLALLLWMFNKFAHRAFPLTRERGFWVMAGTLLVASRFVLRDFDDGGQNLILLALTWGGIYLWTAGKPVLAGSSLGLATALKCTPALFILYFAWKRQWKFAIASGLFALLFTLAPAIRGQSYFREMRAWFQVVMKGTMQPDPSIGILGPEELQNKSLRPALARYLTRLPAGHPGRVQSPAYIDFITLPPAEAGRIIKVILLVLLAAAAWRFRAPVADTGAISVIWECAGVSLLGLLYSPITWGQHCVAALPALYLILRGRINLAHDSRGVSIVMGIIGVILVLGNRSFIGRDASLLLESYHPVTFCLLALLGIILTQAPPDETRPE